jgi:hypothetical protein
MLLYKLYSIALVISYTDWYCIRLRFLLLAWDLDPGLRLLCVLYTNSDETYTNKYRAEHDSRCRRTSRECIPNDRKRDWKCHAERDNKRGCVERGLSIEKVGNEDDESLSIILAKLVRGIGRINFSYRCAKHNPRTRIRRNLESFKSGEVENSSKTKTNNNVRQPDKTEEENHVDATCVSNPRVDEYNIRGPEDGRPEREGIAKKRCAR